MNCDIFFLLNVVCNSKGFFCPERDSRDPDSSAPKGSRKKVIFSSGRTTRWGGGGGKGQTTKKKELFYALKNPKKL